MENLKLLAVLVNYGTEQLEYLRQVVISLKSFKKYDVKIIVNSNIHLNIKEIDVVNVLKLDDYKMLPLTCRKVVWENRHDFDVFVYGENDHLFIENHIDKHIEYTKILPKNRIPGLMQYEQSDTEIFYPAYHGPFDWNYKSVEVFENKKFARFGNLHQASFILTKAQLDKVSFKFDFTKSVIDKESFFNKLKRRLVRCLEIKVKGPIFYDSLCKTCTDVYQYGGMKKVICISEFEESLIHHLPNLYIHGEKGRKKLRSSHYRMRKALDKLLKE